jgi:hypothetical protein
MLPLKYSKGYADFIPFIVRTVKKRLKKMREREKEQDEG